jgi:predicted glycoside hydrolase/deacetylase ChbG (UPF0249 family)
MTSPNTGGTNALLGYPVDARLLIVNADDFGMCHSVNQAVVRAWRDGVVSSTTVMAPCPWAPHAMRLLAENPGLPFGVHLTVICDFPHYRWGPLAPRDKVPSLVDDAGYFFAEDRVRTLLPRVALSELEAEFRAQVAAVLAAGLRPTHLDFHCLADGGRADVFEMTLGLAREHGLALRVHDRSRARACRRSGLPANDHEVLDSCRLDPADKPACYVRLLRDLPAGLSEWAVHPGLGDAEARTLWPTRWRIRESDLDFLVSRQARDVLDEEGIVLLDFRSLQTVWLR